MTCGIFSLNVCWEHFTGLFWFLQYWPWFFYGLVGLALIYILSKAKELFGVQGEVGVLGIFAFLGGIWFDRTKLQKKPVPQVNQPKYQKPRVASPSWKDTLPPKSLTESDF